MRKMKKIKIVMITLKVDEEDSVVGFIPSWIEALSERIEELYVISMKNKNLKNKNNKNKNIFILSNKKYKKIFEFFLVMRKLIKNIDVIFCHMMPLYVILAWPLAKLYKKPIFLWRAHKKISLIYRLAHLLTNYVITPSETSVPILDNKVIIIGHGIDEKIFKHEYTTQRDKIILSVGRLAPIKRYELLIEAINIIFHKWGIKQIEVHIVGDVAIKRDIKYYEKLKKMVNDYKLKQVIKFIGAVPYNRMPLYYNIAYIYVHLCPTGALDKAVLEAMMASLPTVVCNEGFKYLLGEYKEKLLFKEDSYIDLAEKIAMLLTSSDDILKKIGTFLQQNAIKYHALSNFMDNLVNIFTLK